MTDRAFIFGFAGWSGSGKTTLAEKIIKRAAQSDIQIATIKHAHHNFDADIAGKDSWRHRKAGANQVLVASDRRMALFTEKTDHKAPQLSDMLSRLDPFDWVLVEGFKKEVFTKIEIFDKELSDVPLYHSDRSIIAVVSKSPLTRCHLPQFDRDDDEALFAFLVRTACVGA